MAYNDYEVLDPYGNYGDKDDMSPYEMLMRMKAWNKNIYLTIESMDKEIRTQLSILDQEITARIDDFEKDMHTQLSVMNGEITARINDFENDVHTQFSVMNGEISSKVSKVDYNGNTIASLINQTATSIKILANKIDLSGYVTISSLKEGGTTEIDGSRITTGYISADRIQASVVLAKLIAAGGISADMITSGKISSSRLDADVILSKVIQAGGISADYITSGTIDSSLLDADVILSKLISAGGISADYITSGTIDSVEINSAEIHAGTIEGVTIDTTEDIRIGRNLTMSYSKGEIQLPGGATIGGDLGEMWLSAIDLMVEADTVFHRDVQIRDGSRTYDILRTRTNGLEITKSSNSDTLLVVKEDGRTIGYIRLD